MGIGWYFRDCHYAIPLPLVIYCHEDFGWDLSYLFRLSRFKTVRRGYQLAGQVEDKHSWGASAIRSFTTSILNIKTGLFVISLFSLAIPREHDYRIAILVIATMMLITFVWHCLLAFVFSHSRAQKTYFRLQRYIDALTGGLFTLLGLKLITS